MKKVTTPWIAGRSLIPSRAVRRVAAAGVMSLLFSAASVQAQSIWSATPTTGNWNDVANWDPTLPSGLPISGSTLTFNTSTFTTLNNDFTSFSFNGLTFGVGSSAFTIAGNAITLAGGITNSGTALQTINLNMATTAVRTVTTTTGGGNVTLGGDISGAGGGITSSGAGVLTLKGNNSYTGATTINGTSTLVVGSNTALGTGSLNFSNSGATLRGDGTARVIGNSIVNVASSGFIIGGSSDLTFNGQINYTAGSGSRDLNIINAGTTTFSGGWVLSNALGSRTDLLQGSGNILIDGPIQPFTGATAAQTLLYAGSGTLTLAPGTTGSVVGSSVATGTATIQAGTGVAPLANQGLVSTIRIAGNYTVGSSGPATMVIKGGDATATNRGVLSTVDGTSNTLTIKSNAASSSTVLTMANGTGLASGLNMEVGATADQIYLGTNGANQRLSVAAGGVLLNLTGIGNLDGTTQDLIVTGNTAALTGFTLSTSGNNNGYVLALATPAPSAGVTKLQVTQTPKAFQTTAYWKGGVDGNWNGFTGGNTNTSNWTDSSGTTNNFQKPDSTTDVFFNAPGAANTSTTLGANFTVKSLTFNSNASIGGGNTLTVNNATTGITANTGATGTISAIVGGSSGVTKNGVGTLVLSGNNTFTGGVLINDGAVRASSTGALNSTTPQAVTFGASAPATAKLQLDGNAITISSLSTNATPGTPIVENANASAATLTINQSGNTTYAGSIQNGTGTLNLVKSGAGTLALNGTNTYTGTTSVTNGTLGGTGSLTSAVTVSSGARITANTIGTTGTLTLSGGLTLNSGSIAYFDIVEGGANDSFTISGGAFTLSSGSIIRVPGTLSLGAVYTLANYSSGGSLTGVIFQDTAGTTITNPNYVWSSTGGQFQLTINAASTAVPTITIAAPTDGARVMAGQSVGISGQIGNIGVADLHGVISDNGGNLTVTSISPAGSTTVAPSGNAPYTGTVNTGVTLGSRTYSVKVDDAAAAPTSVSKTNSLTVLDNRTVNASTAAFGPVHIGAPVSTTTSLTSTQPDDQYTRVTVANGTSGSFSTSGGTNPTFNGSTSDTRTVSVTSFGSLGAQSGTALTLTTTGESLAGEVPINVPVNYTASVYSGTATWASTTGGSWGTHANWGDTNVGNLGAAGAPGLDGSFSANDTATFGNVGGLGATATVSLNGANPTVKALNFTSTGTAYTVAPGSGGAITLQASNTVNVSGSALTPTISAPLTGSNGLNKDGTGTLVLSGASTYTGDTAINNGTVQLTSGADRLPATTALTLGSAGGNNGKLILGTGAVAANQTVTGLQTAAGAGTGSSIVGGASTVSTLTVGVASGTNTFNGVIGGGNTNENNIALTKTGPGALVLSQAPTYTGATTISGLLQVPSASNLSGFINFTNNTLLTPDILQTSGTLSKNISATNAAGNLNWIPFTGFAAKGGALTVTMNGGSQLTFGAGGFMGTGGAAMMFGSPTADSQVNVTNAINLASTDAFQRPIYVDQGTGTDSVKFSGVLSPGTGATGIGKFGNGTLILSGANTYSGATNVNTGTLKIENSSALGYSVNVPVGNISSGANATTVAAGATLDLNGQTGILETINLNGTGIGGNGALINSNTSTAATIDVGLTGINLANAGTLGSYSASPVVTISGVNGTGATGTAVLGLTAQASNITLTNAGSGYTTAPTVTITDSTGVGATATATVSGINIATASNVGGAGDITVNALVTGGGAITKVGAGKVTLNGVNTYTGATTVSNGTLMIDGAGSINTTASVTITGGTFNYASSVGLNRNITLNGSLANFKYNSSVAYSGTLTVTQGTVSGSGNLSAVALTIGTGGILSPGNSPGTLNSGATTYATGGTYLWEINALATSAVPGSQGNNPGWDWNNVASLDVSAGTGEFTLTLQTLGGALDNWNASGTYAWTIATSAADIVGFNAADFVIDDSLFAGGTPGIFTVSLSGDNKSLVLNYSVPEPSTYALVLGGLGMLAFLRRRNKASNN